MFLFPSRILREHFCMIIKKQKPVEAFRYLSLCLQCTVAEESELAQALGKNLIGSSVKMLVKNHF